MSDGVVLSEVMELERTRGTQPLVPMMDRALAEAGASLDDIALLACAIGPGSFTGLRVGLATLKGIAMARDLPLVGVSTLRAVAASVQTDAEMIAAIQDAKKGEVYAALFSGDEIRIEEGAYRPVVLARALSLTIAGSSLCMAGDGIDLVAEHVPERLMQHCDVQRVPQPLPGAVARLAVGLGNRGDALDVDAAEPAYHRLSEAQVHLGGKKKKPDIPAI